MRAFRPGIFAGQVIQEIEESPRPDGSHATQQGRAADRVSHIPRHGRQIWQLANHFIERLCDDSGESPREGARRGTSEVQLRVSNSVNPFLGPWRAHACVPMAPDVFGYLLGKRASNRRLRGGLLSTIPDSVKLTTTQIAKRTNKRTLKSSHDPTCQSSPRVGWTQAEIGEAMGLSRQGAAKVVPQISEILKVAKTQLAKTHQIEEVAEAWGFHSPRSG
jgi:hypothetical protein